jgi:hypothetical protein
VPIAITDEQLAWQASIRDWAKRAGPLALARGLEPASPAAVVAERVLGLPREEVR